MYPRFSFSLATRRRSGATAAMLDGWHATSRGAMTPTTPTSCCSSACVSPPLASSSSSSTSCSSPTGVQRPLSRSGFGLRVARDRLHPVTACGTTADRTASDFAAPSRAPLGGTQQKASRELDDPHCSRNGGVVLPRPRLNIVTSFFRVRRLPGAIDLSGTGAFGGETTAAASSAALFHGHPQIVGALPLPPCQQRQQEYVECLYRNAIHPDVANIALIVQDAESFQMLVEDVLPPLRTLQLALAAAKTPPGGDDLSAQHAAHNHHRAQGTAVVANILPILHRGAPGQPTYGDLFRLARALFGHSSRQHPCPPRGGRLLGSSHSTSTAAAAASSAASARAEDVGASTSASVSHDACMICNADVHVSEKGWNMTRLSEVLRLEEEEEEAGSPLPTTSTHHSPDVRRRRRVAVALTRHESDNAADCPLIDDYRGSHDAFVLAAPSLLSLTDEFIRAVDHPQNCYRGENIVVHALIHATATMGVAGGRRRVAAHGGDDGRGCPVTTEDHDDGGESTSTASRLFEGVANPCKSVRLVHRHAADVRQWLPPVAAEGERYGLAPPSH